MTEPPLPGVPQPDPDGPPGGDTDRAFADLVAHWDDDPSSAVWPASEDIAGPRMPPTVIVRPARPARPDEVVTPVATTPDGDDGDDEEHYEPPPAPPVPPMSPVTRWALASIALGVALLVGPAIIMSEQSIAFETVAVFLVVGGVGTLVSRLRDHRDGDDRPDDGAVV